MKSAHPAGPPAPGPLAPRPPRRRPPAGWCGTLAIALAGLGLGGSAGAAAPAAESVVPATTKVFVSLPSVPRLREDFDKTEIGGLLADPVMEGFRRSLRDQIRRRLETEGIRLGLTVEDVEGVATGELAVARIQPGGKDGAFATMLLIDAKGREDQLKTVLAKVDATLAKDGATRSTVTVGGQAVVRHAVPPRRAGDLARTIDYVVLDGLLIACDHEAELAAALGRMAGGAGSLATVADYKTVMAKLGEAAGGDVAPHGRWFVEPFGAAAVARASIASRIRRGNDILEAFQKQGFDAVKAVGGIATLGANKHDLVHQSYVLAPPTAPGGKYKAAAKMLDFPTGKPLDPAAWVPPSISLHVAMNWNIKEAFEAASPLVNEIAGDEVFEGTLESLKLDPSGPRIDIRHEIVAHLGQRIYVISDQEKPITVTSERLLTAIELTKPDPVRVAIAKALEKDSRPIKVGDVTIWEYFNEPLDMEVEDPDLGFGGGFGANDAPGDGAAGGPAVEPLFSKLYVTVLHGYLMIATRESILRDMIAAKGGLADEATYMDVDAALNGLSEGEDVARTFTRTREAYQTTYELLRAGKMPQAESLLGKLLNRGMGGDDPAVVRKAEFDGSTLPPFEKVADRLMPSGVRVVQREDGWLVVGCILSGKE